MRGENAWLDAADLIPGGIATIFDVGANVGQTSLELSGLFPEASIWAFEPVASTFAMLEANTGQLTKTQRFPLALNDVPGEAEIHLQPDSGWNSLRKNLDRGLGRTTIRLETLDRFCHLHEIRHINLLKTDTEGNDLAVLKGGAGMLESGAVDAIVCEVGFYAADLGHSNFTDLLAWLQPRSFQFFGLYGVEGLRFVDHPEEPCYPWTNALFLRNALVYARYGTDYAEWISSIRAKSSPPE